MQKCFRKRTKNLETQSKADNILLSENKNQYRPQLRQLSIVFRKWFSGLLSFRHAEMS